MFDDHNSVSGSSSSSNNKSWLAGEDRQTNKLTNQTMENLEPQVDGQRKDQLRGLRRAKGGQFGEPGGSVCQLALRGRSSSAGSARGNMSNVWRSGPLEKIKLLVVVVTATVFGDRRAKKIELSFFEKKGFCLLAQLLCRC